jgi:GNAT superfamily N-acetyltransferase
MGYEIVSHTPARDSQIARLQTSLWSGDPCLNAAYLKWKYGDNPFLGETMIQVATLNGDVVGMRGMFGSLWEVDAAERHLLPYADDFVVAPEHRNRGLATRIMTASLEDATRRGFPFAVNLGSSAVTFMSSLAAGWRSAGTYGAMWRTRKPDPRLEGLRRLAQRSRWYWRLNAWRNALMPPSGAFGFLDRNGGKDLPRVTVSREVRADEMAALIARVPWDGRIRHVRNEAYLAWRFRNPLHEYRFLYWHDSGLQGYLVLQRSLSDRADAAIVSLSDWEATDDRVRAGLLDAALRWGRFERVHALVRDPESHFARLLRQRGFETSEAKDLRARSRGVLVRRLGSGAEPWLLGTRNLLDIHDWDLRMVYSMAG